MNDQTGMSYNTDQAHWEEMGITTGEDLARSVLSNVYSDTYKEKEGIRPRWVNFDKMPIKDIQAMIDSLDADEDVDDEGWFYLPHYHGEAFKRFLHKLKIIFWG